MESDHIDEATMELEFSEEDIAYVILDEDDNEIGIALYDEKGNEVEYYYAEGEEGLGIELDDFDADGTSIAMDIVDEEGACAAPSEESSETIELEIDEEDISYYIVDEQGNELGFAVTEADGTETEYYYEGIDADSYELVSDESVVKGTASKSEDGKQVPKQPPASFVERAGEQAGKVAFAAKDTFDRIKKDPASLKDDLGISKEGMKRAADDLGAIAKEGAAAAAELKEAYDDIFGNLPGAKRRR